MTTPTDTAKLREMLARYEAIDHWAQSRTVAEAREWGMVKRELQNVDEYLPTLLDEIDTLRARVGDLESKQCDWTIERTIGQRQLDDLIRALQPFAKLGGMLTGPFAPALFRDDQPAGIGGAWSENGEPRTVTFGDLRAAHKAIQEPSHDG